MVAEVTYLTWTEDNLLREVQREDKPARQVVLAPQEPEGTPFGTYLERCHSYITISKPLSFQAMKVVKRRWQRGLAIEHALIVLLIAFSAFQFLFVIGATVG